MSISKLYESYRNLQKLHNCKPKYVAILLMLEQGSSRRCCYNNLLVRM